MYFWILCLLRCLLQPQKEKVKKNPRKQDTSSDFFTRQNDKEDWRTQNIHLQSSLVSNSQLPLEPLYVHTAEDTTDYDPEGSVLMIFQSCHGDIYRPLIKGL